MTAPAKKKKENTETGKGAASSPAANANAAAAGGKKSKKLMLAGVLALVIGACILLVVNVGGLARMGAERAATLALGVPVKIASLDVSLQNKEITVAGIRVANPQGYTDAAALDVGSMKIAAESIDQQLLVFNQIGVEGATILFETTEAGSNLTQIRRQAMSGSQAAAASETGDAQGDVKVIIKELLIKNATLQPAGLAAGVSAASVTLPDIRIAGIGEREGGVSAAVAMAYVTDAVSKVAIRAALDQGLLAGIAPENLQMIQQDLGMPESIMDQVRGIGDKVKSLFGN